MSYAGCSKRVISSSHEPFREELPAPVYSLSVPWCTVPDMILQNPGYQDGAFCFLLKNRTISLSTRVICSAEAALGRLMESRRSITRPLELPLGCSLHLQQNQVIFTLLIRSHQTTSGRKRAREVWRRSNSHFTHFYPILYYSQGTSCWWLEELIFLCPPLKLLVSSTDQTKSVQKRKN